MSYSCKYRHIVISQSVCDWHLLPFQTNICRQGQESTIRMESCQVFHSCGSALPANIRLEWKWMEVANTLAYCDTATIQSIKSFMELVFSDFVVKLKFQFFNFFSPFYLYPVQPAGPGLELGNCDIQSGMNYLLYF